MRHPESLLMPVLFLTDYYLTVLGNVMKEGVYSRHYRIEHYEMNPIWQRDIARKRWFNPRHLLLVVVFSALIIGLCEAMSRPDFLAAAFLGALFAIWGALLGVHIANLLLFRYLNQHPDCVSGEIVLSHRFLLHVTMWMYLKALIPMGIIAFFSASPYAIGAFGGLLLILLLHVRFRLAHARQRSKAAAFDSNDAPSEASGSEEFG